MQKQWPPAENGVYIDYFFNTYYKPGASHTDGMDESLNEVMEDHWSQYPPQNPMILRAVGFAFIILLFLSILGNGCVIYIFTKTKSLRTPSNMFVVNLALSDLCMMTTHGIPVAINTFTQSSWMWGVLGCHLFAALGGVFGTTSIMSMVLIGYDRYNVIVKGLNCVKISQGKALGMIGTVWIYSVCASTGPFLGWGAYAMEGLMITCSYNYIRDDWHAKSYICYIIATHWFIPMCMVIFFYTQIAKAVISHERSLKDQAKKMGVDDIRANQNSDESAEVKIAKVAITNILLWIVTWWPYAFVVMIGIAGRYELLTPLVAGLPSLLIKVTSSLNPLVFAIAHPKFREAMAVEMPCLGIGNKPKKAVSDTVTTVTTQA